MYDFGQTDQQTDCSLLMQKSSNSHFRNNLKPRLGIKYKKNAV